MHRGCVEEGEEAPALNHHVDDHAVLHLNPCQRTRRNHQCVSHGVHDCVGRVCSLPSVSCAIIIEVVARLQVEQPLALVPTHKGLIAIIA
jgi:hypothetical protein